MNNKNNRAQRNYSEDAKNFYLDQMNKKKREDIEKKYGADFYKKDDITPEIESEFLNEIEEFEIL